MSDITRVRKIMAEVADELEARGDNDDLVDILREANELTYRRAAARRAPIHSVRVTDEIREQIREMAQTTDLHSSEIAARLGVNPGRVSEVLQDD